MVNGTADLSASRENIDTSPGMGLSPYWHVAAGLLFLAVAGLLVVLYHGSAYDDAYITFRYARNIADGYGFCYNPGSPSLGTTTPLFTLLLAGLASLGVDIPAAGSVLTILSLLLLAAVLYLTQILDGRPLSGIVAGLLILVNYRLVLTIGGESVLLCLLVFAAAYFSEVRDRPVSAAVLLSLAALTRGEGLLAAPVLLTLYIYRKRRFPWTAALVYLSIFGGWLIFSWWSVGALTPSTMSAKMAQGQSGLFHGFWAKFFIWAGRTIRLNWLWGLLLVPSAIGLCRILRSQGGRAGRVIRAYLIWVALYCLGYSLLGVAGYHWYSVPIIIALLCLAATGLPLSPDADNSWRCMGKKSRLIYRGVLATTLIIFSVFLFFEARAIKRNVGIRSPFTTLYPLTAERLNKLAGPEESVAYLEIGVIGYLFHGKTLDLLGLTGDIDHEQIAKGNLIWGIIEMDPDWYIDVPQFGFMTSFVVGEPWFLQTYSLVETVVHPAFPKRPARLYRRNGGVPMPASRALDIVQRQGEQTVGNIIPSTVGQSFLSHRDGLIRIDISPSREERGSLKFGDALMRIREAGPEGREMMRIRISGNRFGDNKRYIPVRLNRPMPVKDKLLYFSIEAAGKNSDVLPTLLFSSKNVYDGGTLHLNGEPVEGDLVFRTWHRDR